MAFLPHSPLLWRCGCSLPGILRLILEVELLPIYMTMFEKFIEYGLGLQLVQLFLPWPWKIAFNYVIETKLGEIMLKIGTRDPFSSHPLHVCMPHFQPQDWMPNSFTTTAFIVPTLHADTRETLAAMIWQWWLFSCQIKIRGFSCRCLWNLVGI